MSVLCRSFLASCHSLALCSPADNREANSDGSMLSSTSCSTSPSCFETDNGCNHATNGNIKKRICTRIKSLGRLALMFSTNAWKYSFKFIKCFVKLIFDIIVFLPNTLGRLVCGRPDTYDFDEKEDEEDDEDEQKEEGNEHKKVTKNKFYAFINGLANKQKRNLFLKFIRSSSKELVEENEKNRKAEKKAKLVGNEVDMRMFKASGYFMREENDQYLFHSPDAHTVLKPIKRFEFDRRSMTMSVVMENVNTRERWVYCKGSAEQIAERVLKNTLPEDFHQVATQVAKEEYYAIGMAYAPYNGPADVEKLRREMIEKDLIALGVLLFRNELKQSSKHVIEELKEGKIRPVMITGDNVHTAIKISRECGLSTAQTLLIGDVKKCNKDSSSSSNCNNEVEWRDADTDEVYDTPRRIIDQLRTGEAELAITGSAFDILKENIKKESAEAEEKEENKNEKNDNSSDEEGGISMHTTTCDSPKQTRDNSSFSSPSCFFPVTPSSPPLSACSGPLPPVDPSVMLIPSQNEKTTKMQLTDNEITRFTRIYARVKPPQKVAVVSDNMKLGITAMCGDGANDAGALRMAHCGIALSSGGNSDATIVAPFSTTRKSLRCVIEMIRYGRCALASAFAGYKALIVYGQTLVSLTMVEYYIGVMPPEAYWILWDGVINVCMAWAIMQSYPSKRLAPHRPTSKLLGTETIASVSMQLLWNWLTMALSIYLLFQQSWFVCKEFDSFLVDQDSWWLKGDNYEDLIISIVGLSQIIFTAAIVNFGFDYRRSSYRNYWLMLFFVLSSALASYLLLGGPSALTCLFRSNCGDYSLVKRWGEIGKLDMIYGRPFTMPEGCPCSEQIGFSNTCENEYIQCKNNKFNQTYHHNILPVYYRYIMFLIIIVDFCLCFISEKYICTGFVRRFLRRKKEEKRTKKQNEQRKKVMDNNNGVHSSHDEYDYTYDDLIIGGINKKNNLTFSLNNNNNSDNNKSSSYAGL